MSKILRLPKDSVQIDDPDEEVFLLYTRLAGKGAQDGNRAFAGLGSVDSKNDILNVSITLPPRLRNTVLTGTSPKDRVHKKSKNNIAEETRSLEIELVQNKTILRSKKGDTGSVLWRVSVELGQIMTRYLCSRDPQSIFDPKELARSHVLELGAGTGLLGLLLSPWVRRYTATDLDYLLPLIQRNIDHNTDQVGQSLAHYGFLGDASESKISTSPSRKTVHDNRTKHLTNISVESLDWAMFMSKTKPRLSWKKPGTDGDDSPDLIIAADCIFNPSLLPPLVATLASLAQPRPRLSQDGSEQEVLRPLVLVVAELRSEEVVREFLELWLASGEWEIWRVELEGDEKAQVPWLDPSFVLWTGWRIEGYLGADLACSH